MRPRGSPEAPDPASPLAGQTPSAGGRAAARACTLACLEIPAFSLQILLAQRPEWRAHATLVVDEDRPQGLVTHVSTAARRAGILPGQRYAHALGLARDVRAGVVPPSVVGAATAQVLASLRAFSPNIEPSEDEPGVFWIDVSGLGGLYDTLLAWARRVLGELSRAGFSALVALGFTRFGTYAGVKSLAYERARSTGGVERHEPVRVMLHRDAERALAMQVPLGYLRISAGVRERLERLGVHTLGELMVLPAAGVMKRWGPEALALHRMAQRLAEPDAALPLLDEVTSDRIHPVAEVLPARALAILDFLEHDAHRLLFRIKSLLDEVLTLVRERSSLVAELVVELAFDRGDPPTSHRFRPAAPTLDGALLIDLVRLRLESVDLTAGVTEVRLEALETPATPEQMRLFKLGPHQDGAAAARALARVQAELGEGAVGTMCLRDAHLPRARQAFVPLVFSQGHANALPAPRVALAEAPDPSAPPPLVRRLHPRPEPLPPRPRDLRNDGWQPRDPAHGAIVAVHGPFVITGGWWLGDGASEVHREYAFVETKRGDLLWIYHDRRRRRWFEEGRVD